MELKEIKSFAKKISTHLKVNHFQQMKTKEGTVSVLIGFGIPKSKKPLLEENWSELNEIMISKAI